MDACGDCVVCKELPFPSTVFCTGVETGACGPSAVCMYQEPPPISNSKPAATPIIRPFLPELPVLAEMVSDSSVNRRLPKDGDATAALRDGLYQLSTPDAAADRLSAMLKLFPQIVDVHFWAQFPGESIASGSRRIECLATRVLPKVRAAIA